MMFLLIVSGITASVVGYRVKSADIDRKAQLLKTYDTLGGSFEAAHALGRTVSSPALTPEQQIFARAYEVNCRARAHGLYQVLETSSPEDMEGMIASLFAIDANESGRSAQDAWRAYQEKVSTETVVKNMNPKAARFARQYDRYLARDTEVKLFTYLRDHQSGIAAKR
jgi:hypothetical protein